MCVCGKLLISPQHLAHHRENEAAKYKYHDKTVATSIAACERQRLPHLQALEAAQASVDELSEIAVTPDATPAQVAAAQHVNLQVLQHQGALAPLDAKLQNLKAKHTALHASWRGDFSADAPGFKQPHDVPTDWDSLPTLVERYPVHMPNPPATLNLEQTW